MYPWTEPDGPVKQKIGRFVVIALAALALVLLAACDIDSTAGFASSPEATAIATQALATSTTEQAAAATPMPTQPAATDTLLATDTPVQATDTADPTDTAVPPTDTVEPATETPVAPTNTRVRPTRTRVPGVVAPTSAPAVETAAPESSAGQVVVNGKSYDAYIPAAIKPHQYFHYTCEFDAAWVVLKTYGIDSTLEEQVAAIGLDTSVEPRWEETKDGIFIYGGDISQFYSGDYKENFLARSSGQAMSKVFRHYGLEVTPVHDRAGIEQSLLSGELVWIKVPVDFKSWRPATWVMPDGRTYQTVLGNDHAVVVIGFNKDVVVIRDVLGPTSTNANRKYEYEVPWDLFLKCWGAQSYDGLAVAPPR